MNGPVRILYYNWVDYQDAEGRGGGVTLYQRNVMEALEARADIEASFLCAGLSYDLPVRGPRWERLRHGVGKTRDRRYEIVNSGVLAPAHASFGDPAQVSHPATRDVFFDFVARTGPYDVIHFNNLEGLPADVLSIKEQYRQTQVVVSLHNYYPVCPQVNLWAHERETCEDFESGARCVTCLIQQHDARLLRVAHGLSYRLRCAGLQPGTWAYDVAFRGILGVGRRGVRAANRLRGRQEIAQEVSVLEPHIGVARAGAFAARRADMIALINTHCDRVLCVSDAVRILAQRYGIAPELTCTNYIGTRAAEIYDETTPAQDAAGKQILTLGYLGYMRRDKGFFFLLDALEALPVPIAARLRIVIAARAADRTTMARVHALGTHLAGVIYHDGYTHDELEAVLAPVDVGVVPVLWYDNLPQVAIEMHARHIPLLTAGMGGAPELGNCPDMVFEPGDISGFTRSVQALLAGRIDLDEYWRGAMRPVTVPDHISELLDLYAVQPL